MIRIDRRGFLRAAAFLLAGGRTLLHSGDARAALYAARSTLGRELAWPEMTYRPLGRTGWRASRLVFGCGAALSRGPRDDLLEMAFDAGINVFDVGFRGYYRDAETNLAGFLSRHRDRVFLISKAIPMRDLEPGDALPAAQRKEAAANWARQLDQSLGELEVERVDAYYVMAANNTDLVASDEIRRAFEDAKRLGKVSYLGLSTHQNAESVLTTAAATGIYDLAMIAITPAGWYDWKERAVLVGSPPMKDIRPTLDRARETGMGLIGMKAGRALAGRRFFGRGKPEAFDPYYDEKLMRAGLSAFQRSYAYVLAHGLDAVNADMQSLSHLHENAVAATLSDKHFA